MTTATANSGNDKDNDGVSDECDLDDDNDGILDADEDCSFFTGIAHSASSGSSTVDWPGTSTSTLTITTTGQIEDEFKLEDI